MSIDPRIQALFAQAEQALDPEAFLGGVMARINRDRHRLLVVWAGLSLIMITGFALLASPVIDAIIMATNLLPVSLVEVETDWVRQLLAPINSVAAAFAIGILAIRWFYRRVLR